MTQSLDDPMPRFLIDSHAHLDDSAFDSDRDAVIERARAAGLRYVLSVGGETAPEALGAAVAVAEKHDWVYATAGVHPHEAQHFSDAHVTMLQALAEHPKVLAIGEIGLDYYHGHSPREIQREVLVRQLELAREVKLPVVIHCRDAWADLREVVASLWKSSGLGGILHCFSGSRDDAFQFMDWSFLVSFAGNITFKKAGDLRGVAREIPGDRLLTETDSPYLAPVPFRGRRNEPAYVREVTRALATARNTSEEELARQALENFVRFFRLD